MLGRLCCDSLRPAAPTKVAYRAGIKNDIQTAVSTSEIDQFYTPVFDKWRLHVDNNKCVC